MTFQITGSERATSNRTFRGRWSSTTTSAELVPGTLEIGPSKWPRLDLSGSLARVTDLNPRVLFGTAHDGTELTLVETDLVAQHAPRTAGGSAVFPPPVVEEAWEAWAVAIGAHVPEGSDTSIVEMTFRSRMLSEWASGVALKFQRATKKGVIGGTISLPEPILVSLPFGEMSFEWASLGTESGMNAEYQVFQQVRVRFGEPVTVHETWDMVVVPLLQLFTFFVGAGDWLQSLRYVQDGAVDEFTISRDQFGVPLRSGEFEWLPASWMARPHDREPPHHFEQLVQARDVLENLPALVAEWFALQRRLQGALLDYFSVQMWPEMTVNESFYRVVRALEVTHGVLDPSPKISKGEFAAIRSSIKQALDGNAHKNFIMSRLSHADKPSLRERLLALYDRVGPRISEYSPDGHEAFVSNVVKTRDGMTHTGNGGPLVDSLTRSFRVLDTLMRQVLLVELGFTPAEADKQSLRTRDARIILSPPYGAGS